jgi:hypothetical protein
MHDWKNKIEALDISLFEAILSQTTAGDRRSLLAVQRAMARTHGEYAYLEIGSYLGGTLQPYLADERCKKIYSIDPRPSRLPDERSPGCVWHYEDNSSERMLSLLNGAGLGDVGKIACIESDASQVDPTRIETTPQVVFIDGEHTTRAVMSDYGFCSRIVSKDGVVVFHDFSIIYPALLEICRQLKERKSAFTPVKLEDNVFAIFFDRNILISDAYLSPLYKRHRRFWFSFRAKRFVKQLLPGPLLSWIVKVRNAWRAVEVTPPSTCGE